MRLWRRERPLLSVVVPAYDVEAYLPACLDSVLAQDALPLEVVVVDDGATDGTGEVADRYAAAHPGVVRVLHTANQGLGAARNTGVAEARGALLAFADSDDVVPPGAYAALHRQLQRTGADLVTGSIARWEVGPDGERLVEPRWMRRLHPRRVAVVEQHPEILGDVFAWNKLYRRAFWDGAGLSWPEGVRYEDQPTTTRAYLAARRFGVVPEVVYHWRIRVDGSSITQQRSSVEDLRDRWLTKQMTLRSVEDYGSAAVTRVLREKVLPGDLPRYFAEVPGCSDEWWELLRDGILSLWGGTLTSSTLQPAQRLTGWLVEQGRRADAEALVRHLAEHPGPLPRRRSGDHVLVDVPFLDVRGIPRAALEVRPGE